MKTKNLFFIAIVAMFFFACETNEFNYAPNVEVLYSPVRLNDNASILMRKVSVNNIRIDSMRVGDTLSVRVHLNDLVYKLKSVRFKTDTSTIVLLPTDKDFRSSFTSSSDFEANHLQYKVSKMSDEINFLYIAKKPGKNGHITIYAETQNPDSVNYQDSLRIATPVKILP
jgi:hypothetical protein